MLKKLFFLFCLTPLSVFAAEPQPDIFAPESNILFIGDSVTHGGRGRDPNHFLGHSYVFLVAAEYGAAFPEKKLEFFNRGISGEKVTDIYARRQKDIFNLKPDVFSLLVGVNDANSIVAGWPNPVNAEEFEKVYDRLLQEVKTKFPAAKIILGEPFFLRSGKRSGNAWAAFNAEVELRRQAVHRLAEKHNVPAVPYQKVFDDACRRVPAKYWVWDDIHPTYAGFKLMSDAWLKTYTAFYGETAGKPAEAAGAPDSNHKNNP